MRLFGQRSFSKECFCKCSFSLVCGTETLQNEKGLHWNLTLHIDKLLGHWVTSNLDVAVHRYGYFSVVGVL